MSQTFNPSLPTIEPPAMLRDLKAWLVWQLEPDPSLPKPRKVPYYVNGKRRHGTQGSPSDRKQLVTFAEARDFATKHNYAGVGFCLMPEFNIVAGDFDDCVTPSTTDSDEDVHPDVLRLTAGTYAEYSPSNRGVRAFWQSDSVGNGKDLSRTPFGFELFSTKGFVTFTGCMLHQTEFTACENVIAPMPKDVLKFIKSRFSAPRKASELINDDDPASVLYTYNPPQTTEPGEVQQLLNSISADINYDDWITVGMALHHQYQGSDEGLAIWNTWCATSESKYTEGEPEAKWHSFSTHTQNPITLASLRRVVNEQHTKQLAQQATAVQDDGTDPLQPIQAAEFASKTSTTEYLIKDFLPRGELSVVYGAPGSGKTFAVLDMCMAVAFNEQWRDKTVTPGAILYVACEGGQGFRKRIKAYAQHFEKENALPAAPFYVIDAAPNFMDAAIVNRILAHAVDIPNLSAIVIDTLSRALQGGDENSSTDLGTVINHCTHLYRETGASVVLVHHSGKNKSANMRGHSSLQGAAYAVIEVQKRGFYRALAVEKLKDGEAEQAYPFSLVPVVIGKDDQGDDITSCVVKHQTTQDAFADVKLTAFATKAREVLVEMLETGEPPTITGIEDAIVAQKQKELQSGDKDLSESYKRKLRQRCRDGIEELVEKMPAAIGMGADGDTLVVHKEEAFIMLGDDDV